MARRDQALVFVAFGITGDLMRQKILPALGALHAKGALPPHCAIIGVTRRNWDDGQLRLYVAGAVPHAADGFLPRFSVLQGDSADPAFHASLSKKLQLAQAAGAPNKILFYLSIAPDVYEGTIANIAALPPIGHSSGWPRIAIEKPFATSSASAQTLNQLLAATFAEEQIYRVDHYLGKSMADKLAQSSVPDIRRIGIRIMETAGVEDRAAFYDRIGALRDIGQNHMLQLLALALPGQGDRWADRARALELLPTLTAQEIASQTVRGQYDGYRQIAGIAPKSQTETYFKIDFALPWQGSGIAVTLEGGKRLDRTHKEVAIETRAGHTRVFTDTPAPETEYERLFTDCFAGNKKRFVGMREVEAQWRFIDPILNAWRGGVAPLKHYAPGSRLEN